MKTYPDLQTAMRAVPKAIQYAIQPDHGCIAYEPGDESQLPVKSSDPGADLESATVALVQTRLDAFAQSRGYDGILSACSYAVSRNQQFASEGQYCVDARDEHWALCYRILRDVQSGKIPLPSLDFVMLQMPNLIWPV